MELKAYIEDLLAAEDLRPATLRVYGTAMRRYIVPGLGHLDVEAIDAPTLRSFFAKLHRDSVGHGAVGMVHRLLNKAFKTALTDGLIDRNPLASVRAPRKPRLRLDPPTPDELERIVAAIAPHYRALVRLLAWTGLRIGEAGGLMVEDFDPATRRLYVRRQMTRNGLADLKTDAARRIVVVPEFVAAELGRHLEQFPPVEGRMFSTRRGRPVWSDIFFPPFRDACKRAGVRHFHPHELRHHAVSAMARSGAPIKAVQAVVGHTSAKLTLDVYSHVTQQDLEDVAARLDAAAAGA